MKLYLGLAIATTDWTAWQMRGPSQFWWTLPFMAGQIQQPLEFCARAMGSIAYPSGRFSPEPARELVRITFA